LEYLSVDVMVRMTVAWKVAWMDDWLVVLLAYWKAVLLAT